MVATASTFCLVIVTWWWCGAEAVNYHRAKRPTWLDLLQWDQLNDPHLVVKFNEEWKGRLEERSQATDEIGLESRSNLFNLCKSH